MWDIYTVFKSCDRAIDVGVIAMDNDSQYVQYQET